MDSHDLLPLPPRDRNPSSSTTSGWSIVEEDLFNEEMPSELATVLYPGKQKDWISTLNVEPPICHSECEVVRPSHPRSDSSVSNVTIMPSGNGVREETGSDLTQCNTSASLERPECPPDILKDEITFLKRIFDGSYSDVWCGEWKGRMVAVKVLRCLKLSEEAMNRKRAREVKTWWELEHPSILPLLGYVEDMGPMGPLGAMVSPYCMYGNALSYLATSQPTYRSRITLWSQVLDGTSFLHGYYPMIVHGDLKPANVVIDEYEHARICDFGLARLILDHGNTGLTTTTAHTGTTRYKSRELALNSRAKPTASSDVYALGCLGLEFILSKRPYHNREDASLIIGDIQEGAFPARRPKKLVGELGRFGINWKLVGIKTPLNVQQHIRSADMRSGMASPLQRSWKLGLGAMLRWKQGGFQRDD